MESTESLRRYLEGLEVLRDVVRTMKALSAASVRQYDRAVIALADYYRTVELGLMALLREMEPTAPESGEARSDVSLGAIVFGSDHGLCGRFNDDIAVYALERMASRDVRPEHRTVVAVGARVAAKLEQAGERVEADFLVPGTVARITATVRQLLVKMDEWRNAGIRYVYLIYNRPFGRSSYLPTGIEVLPLDFRRFQRLEAEPWPSKRLPTFSMDREMLLTALLRQYFFVTLFRACAESLASEHNSRLVAMQSAERNLQDRFEAVTMEYRRVRQAAITTELLDVVSGFETIAGETGSWS